jgi:hypothetical protein
MRRIEMAKLLVYFTLELICPMDLEWALPASFVVRTSSIRWSATVIRNHCGMPPRAGACLAAASIVILSQGGTKET